MGVSAKIIEFFGGVTADNFKQTITEIKAERVGSYVTYGEGFALPYDGEKNLGEIGPIINYWMDYPRLRARSWQSYAESEITRTLINRFITWKIGAGLRLQAQPQVDILSEEGITLDAQSFSMKTEHRYKLFLGSQKSNVSRKFSINALRGEAEKNALIGGDCLIRLFWKDGGVRVQMIDGAHICSPIKTYGNSSTLLENGSCIREGIETDSEGKTVAFHIVKRDLKYERVAAYNKNGIEIAFLFKINTYRPDDARGIPLISVVLQTLASLQRYKEAAVGSAEERAKIPFFVEHSAISDGENPLVTQMANAVRGGVSTGGNADGRLPQTVEGEQLASRVAATVNKQTFNMPIGAKISAVDMKNDMFFKDFYTTNIDIVCACLEIPPDVAFSKYENSYSSSRAALKDWEHTLVVKRDLGAEEFDKKIYRFWLLCNVLNNKITAPGYIEAFRDKNEIVMDAYENCRFVGDNVPHIDPLKEVQAERLKLGDRAVNIPLTTVEEATQAVNSGDSDSNIKQFAEELKITETLGIKTEPIQTAVLDKPKKKKSEE